MKKPESITTFYEQKLNLVAGNRPQEQGPFNVFKITDHKAIPTIFNKREFYKIKLIFGKNRCHYADKTIDIPESAMIFGNPLVPYQIENLADHQTEYFCIFTEAFFSQFGNIREYPVFQPGNNPVYFLQPEEIKEVIAIYEKMETEIHSGYEYKYDVLRTLVYELIHKVMKMKPATVILSKGPDANSRIASLFADLLELQFPLVSPQQSIKLRRPQQYAEHLSVHINHLNRALKNALGKTTSQCISARIMQEAVILLKHTDWTVAEIGYTLGFEESSHFISAFKKQMGQPPRIFRTLVS